MNDTLTDNATDNTIEIASDSTGDSPDYPNYSVIAIGGVREIGKNMWLISNGDELLMMDAGFKFPSEDMYGVDYLLPDMTYVLENQERLKGIVLTHAHEDHVGALTTLLELLDNPPDIYGSDLTLGMLEERITDVDKAFATLLKPIKGRDRLHIGGFDVEFLHVCHSISGALGLAIHTERGAIVFTGDFKMDPTPIDLQPTDYFKFADLGEKGVLLLVSDSTNATNPGHTISENEVAQNFTNYFYRAKGRIIIATFASSLHRIQQLVNRCVEFDRKITFMGRSMERNTAKAHEMGFLTYPEGIVIKPENIADYSDEQLVIVTTGSQGEPTSALSRMAKGRFHALTIKEGDTVIFSSKPIPGNERSVYQNVNRLCEKGAIVLYESRRGLHASGHASQEELKLMLNLTKPRYFAPTHGEYHQMLSHSELAQATGVLKENIFLLDLGERLELGAKSAHVAEKVTAGEIMVTGRGSGYLEEKELRERHRMVKDGVLFASLHVLGDLSQIALPKLVSKGFIIDEGSEDLLKELAQSLLESLTKQFEKWLKANKAVSTDQIEKAMIDHLSRIVNFKTHRRPVVIPLVHGYEPVPADDTNEGNDHSQTSDPDSLGTASVDAESASD